MGELLGRRRMGMTIAFNSMIRLERCPSRRDVESCPVPLLSSPSSIFLYQAQFSLVMEYPVESYLVAHSHTLKKNDRCLI